MRSLIYNSLEQGSNFLEDVIQKAFSNIEEDDEGNLLYRFPLAGYSKDNIKVEFDENLNRLKISAEENTENKRAAYSQIVSTPKGVEPGDVSSKYADGLLTVKISSDRKEREVNKIHQIEVS